MIEITEKELKQKENHYMQLAEDGEPILLLNQMVTNILWFLRNQMT